MGFLAEDTPWLPMSIHKKFKPNRSRRLAGYIQHKYIQIFCFIIIDYIDYIDVQE